ncbi:hypothetical protein CSC03_4284 [Enterobacter hormaechei]|nr:hypothetical protein CSB67_2187 [Enterobacter hormaechei]PRW21512.1 hypothetical protein CSC03_4284 [Enterobacter hormaechei]RAL74632.1 hypothetical protein CSC35_3167 [Enterobacter hormaechei]
MGVNELSILGITSLITADIVTTVTNNVNELFVRLYPPNVCHHQKAPGKSVTR